MVGGNNNTELMIDSYAKCNLRQILMMRDRIYWFG